MERSKIVGTQRGYSRLLMGTGLAVGLICLGMALLFGNASSVRAAPEAEERSSRIAQESAWGYLDPSSAKLAGGEQVTLTVRLDEVSQLYGFQYKIFFDAAVLEVVDADGDAPGVQICSSEALLEGNISAAYNCVNSELGEILYALTMFRETEGVDGPVVLGRVTFRAKSEGLGVVRFGVGPGQSRITCLRGGGTVPSKVVVHSTWTNASITVGNYMLFLPLSRGEE